LRGALAAACLLLSMAQAQADQLELRFIGNMAFAISDGSTTLYTDFPYESGYSDYMTYDFDAVPKTPGALCLITHGHRDHFDAPLFAKMEARLIAPPAVAAKVSAGRAIPFAPKMSYRNIAIEALPTPHASIEHFSYLVTWHGRRLYFTGDTDSTDQLLAMRDLDVAFVSPWLLEAVADKKKSIDAKQVVVYHQTSDENVPLIQNRIVLRQGEAFLLEAAAAPVPRELPASEFSARRAEAMRRMPDGLLLLPSRAFVFRADQLVDPAFLQDPNFYYFTGLSSASGAVLAIDGAARESWLFVPKTLPGFAQMLSMAHIEPGDETAKRLGIEHVVDRKGLPAFLNRRQEETPDLLLYSPGPAGEHGFPLDIALDDPAAAWNHALSELWPQKQLRSSDPVLTAMRLTKSPAEIEVLRRTGRASAAALLAGLAALSPGRSQREAEGRVVSACLSAGAEGPSFWPWVMTGPASAFPAPFESLVDYRHLNRAMQAGEVARVDVGCDLDHYKGDVGRTAPVSGRFDAGQRETWELLAAAYRTGLEKVRAGVKRDDVFAASLAEVRRRQPSLATPLGRKAAETLLGKNGLRYWEIHGVGLDSAEGQPETLEAGMVVAFEPIFSVDGQGFYLEDMVLVTKEGHQILTPGLPYSAAEIEAAVARRPN
jgi:Xaa-Pro aminopeptidase